MSKQKTEEQPDKTDDKVEEKDYKTCFVIMPISDPDGYEKGHFQRVYDGIIKPACKLAGFKARRADESKGTNVIMIDILQQILNADMAVCDISAKNGNVFYELGIRQAFDKPVTLMKDDITDRLFDTNSIREVPYNSQLRYDHVTEAITELSTSIKETYTNWGKELNSLVGLLGVGKAQVKPTDLSDDTRVILDAINNLVRSGQSISPANPKSMGWYAIKFNAKLNDSQFLKVYSILVDFIPFLSNVETNHYVTNEEMADIWFETNSKVDTAELHNRIRNEGLPIVRIVSRSSPFIK